MSATAAVLAATIVAVPGSGDATQPAGQCAGIKDSGVLVARARQAIGSASHKLISFTAKGPTQPITPNAEPAYVEVAAILPDRWVRSSQETRGPDTVTYVSGFNGEALLGDIRGPVTWSPPTGLLRTKALEAQRRSFAAYLLGWFLLPLPGVRETFTYAGEAAYRDRPAVLLSLVDSPMLLRRVWLDRDSCLPLGVVSELPKAPAEQADSGASAPGLVRSELTFFDRRVTSGFQVAYQVQTFDWLGRPKGHWKIERFEINGKVDADLFRPPKR